MANTNLSISTTRGPHSTIAVKSSNLTIGTSAPGAGDFEFRMNALDSNSNQISRLDAILFLEQLIIVLTSGGIYTTDNEQ